MDFSCGREGSRDFISDLPDAIIHHILSLLPYVEIVRSTALSKKFRSLRRSFPQFILRSDWFDSSIRTRSVTAGEYWEMALTSAIDSIQYRDEESPEVGRFALDSRWDLDSDILLRFGSRIDRIVQWAFDHCVGTIDLNFNRCCIRLPPLVSCSSTVARSLTVVKLRGFQLEFQTLLRNRPFLTHVDLKLCSLSSDGGLGCDMVPAGTHLTRLEFYGVVITDQWLKH